MTSTASKKVSSGDTVYVRFGKYTLQALILEDRGRIGARGRHLFRVRLVGESTASEDLELEVPRSAIFLEPQPA